MQEGLSPGEASLKRGLDVFGAAVGLALLVVGALLWALAFWASVG